MAPRIPKEATAMKPKITKRLDRIVKMEYDPYQFPDAKRHRGVSLLHRNFYEDGTSKLFAGSNPVLSLRYDYYHSSDIADNILPDALLDLPDGSVARIRDVPFAEQCWLNEAIDPIRR